MSPPMWVLIGLLGSLVGLISHLWLLGRAWMDGAPAWVVKWLEINAAVALTALLVCLTLVFVMLAGGPVDPANGTEFPTWRQP